MPASYVEDSLKLGSWVVTQRTAACAGDKLSREREQRLEAVSGWVWHTQEARWDENFDALVRFIEREGHARVPASHMEDGFKLGGWVGNQREF